MLNNSEPQQISLFDALENRGTAERERERERESMGFVQPHFG
jgi:hypothetical protein